MSFISILKVNPEKIVKQVQDVHIPVVLTNRCRRVTIVQSLQNYESDMEDRYFMKAVVKGMTDLEGGRELSLADVKKHLKIK